MPSNAKDNNGKSLEEKKRNLPVPADFHDVAHIKRRQFLLAYAENGNTTRSAEIAGCSREAPYSLPWKNDEAFQAGLVEAERMAGDRLEDECRRRAIEGVETPVGWYKGKAGGVVQKYSDTLLIVMLKAKKPEYRESQQIIVNLPTLIVGDLD